MTTVKPMRGAQPWRTNRARVLRANATSAEDRLWAAIRGRRLGGHKFVRQVPIGPYYVDFICRERKLIVEVDGGTHGEDHEIAADQQRTEALTRMGYQVKRATNTDVYDNLPGVLDALLAALDGRSR